MPLYLKGGQFANPPKYGRDWPEISREVRSSRSIAASNRDTETMPEAAAADRA